MTAPVYGRNAIEFLQFRRPYGIFHVGLTVKTVYRKNKMSVFSDTSRIQYYRIPYARDMSTLSVRLFTYK